MEATRTDRGGSVKSMMLDLQDLTVQFRSRRGSMSAVSNASLQIERGQIVGLVGESGCGKSTTALAISRLLPKTARITSGRCEFDGLDLLRIPENEMQRIRGRKIGFVFQDPMTSLNPLLPVGRQISEALSRHLRLSHRAATARAAELLDRVGVPRAKKRMRDFPHQFSGGMRQRVMIAIAISCEPTVIIADEPTTALDVTIQAQVLDLLASISQESGTSVLLITHDFGIAARLCDRISVMYAGQIVESGTTDDIFGRPQMPYTRGLIACIPRIDDDRTQMLRTIEGLPPALSETPIGCRFRPRCDYARELCSTHEPKLTSRLGKEHLARCWATEEGGWLD